jgi:hypothetical protein
MLCIGTHKSASRTPFDNYLTELPDKASGAMHNKFGADREKDRSIQV